MQVKSDMFHKVYSEVFLGNQDWQAIPVKPSHTYTWSKDSTYIQHPPFFENLQKEPEPIRAIHDAYILGLFGDSITTDHISPAGSIKANSPAGLYLKSQGISEADFNSYGARRGTHEVMMRGTFANIRIRNEMTPDIVGGVTRYIPLQTVMPIYDAAMLYQKEQQPLVIIAGKEYGTGSSRDWAAKGTLLLGVKAVIAESFERIHRSNLIGMGVMPLQFLDHMTRLSLGLKGDERITVLYDQALKPGAKLAVTIQNAQGQQQTVQVLCRIDTSNELEYYKNGGILHYVLRNMCS
jgi:aconitate hydratase